MGRGSGVYYWITLFFLLAGYFFVSAIACSAPQQETKVIALPAPVLTGKLSVEAALKARKSSRSYGDGGLGLPEVSQLLWAAQGVNRANGMRTAPSAGALYPMEVYLVAGEVEGLAAGVYRYRSRDHSLLSISTGDQRQELAAVALGQSCVAKGAISLVLTGVIARSAGKYLDRARRYTFIEAGHVGQNIYLQAASLGLGTVTVGAFNDAGLQQLLQLADGEIPIAIMPVGRLG